MTKHAVTRSAEYKKRQLEQQLVRRQANPEKYKLMGRKSEHRRRMKRYGLDEDQFNSMLLEQQGKCKICSTEMKSAAGIDHCHKTGVVRGLLCRKCNFLLGNANESITVLEQAIQYLRSYS